MPILFDAEDKSLHDILFGKEKYKIPRYQRPYSWTKDQVADLWNDLKEEETSFLGSFVFNYEFTAKDKFIEVIDGQQRLITLTIFSAILRDLYRELKDEKKADLTQTSIIEFRNDITGEPTYRLKCGDTLAKFFEKNIQSFDAQISTSTPYRKEEKRVKENYEYLKEQISSELDQITEKIKKIQYLDSLKKKLADMRVIWIRTDNDDDAYSIFETVNARGADLTVADLLKNHLFSKIHDTEDGIDSAKESWINIENNVEGAKGLSVSKLIRYHWLSKYSFISEKNLYKEIKKTITDPESFLEELETSSDYYFMMTSDEINAKTWQDEIGDRRSGLKIFEALQGLRVMGITQSYPLLLCLLANREKIGIDLSKIFKTIENYHFIYSAVCKQPGNRVEKIYFQTARKIQEALQLKPKLRTSVISTILEDFKNALEVPNRDFFIEKFMDIEYRNYSLVLYILSNIERSKGGTDEQIVNFSKVNIEHILPKDPSEWGLTKKDVKEYVDNLGNLTLISERINGSMGNQTLKEKMVWIKKSKLNVNKELVEEIKLNKKKWGKNEIAERQHKIAEFAHDYVWVV